MIACLGTALGGAGISNANDANTAMGPTNSASFVKLAGEANLAEIEAGKLAAKKAQSPEVKQFAEQMVKDHTQASTALEGLAKPKSLDVPKSVNAEHKAAMENLKGLSGADFDSAYMAQMKKDHDKAVALFTSASTATGVDKDLQGFAKKTLPTLEHHQHMAGDLNMKQASATNSNNRKM
jgi:putative membrane protein